MRMSLRGLVVLGLALSALECRLPESLAQQPATPDAMPADPAQVQTRGPIHEAFAQPMEPTPLPGPIVPKQPPDPVSELPPDQKPEGDNVQWIPGYWAWDSDRKDFLWVSGTWRNVPPGRKWVPGNWAQAPGGWRWTTGFWAPAAQTQVPYQQPPPASLDYGPAAPALDTNSFYVPGCWILGGSGYLWRPGYWTVGQPGWVWCPAHYAYTPAGCIYVSGYWDYDLADRGLLFAPVSFTGPVWQNPGYYYTPSYCVDVPNLLGSLFVGPGSCGYFFGDYFSPGCAGLGFQPWCLYGARNFDPLFAYNRWANRGDRGWYRGLRDTYLGRRNGDLARPPRSLAEQGQLLRNPGARDLQPVAALNGFRGGNRRLTPVGQGQLAAQRQAAEQFRAVGRQRQALEQSPGRGGQRAALSLAQLPAAPGRPANAVRPGLSRSTARAPVERANAGFGGYARPSAQPTFRGATPYNSYAQSFSGSRYAAPTYRGPARSFAAPTYRAPAFSGIGRSAPAFRGGFSGFGGGGRGFSGFRGGRSFGGGGRGFSGFRGGRSFGGGGRGGRRR
jgi:hypothetical protein